MKALAGQPKQVSLPATLCIDDEMLLSRLIGHQKRLANLVAYLKSGL